MRTIARLETAGFALAAILVAAAIATYSRYESFDPCIWMEQDTARESSLPRAVVRARIEARFLLRGISHPDTSQCLQAWWKFRADNLPGNS